MQCLSGAAALPPTVNSLLFIRPSPPPPRTLTLAVTLNDGEPSRSEPRVLSCCSCGRRTGLLGAAAAAPLLPITTFAAPVASSSDPTVVMERLRPPRPDWYEEFYAQAMEEGMRSYEAEVAEALPVRENTMDAVIGTLVLCSVKDVDTALREVKRVLKPGGLYVFIEHVAARDGSLLRFVQGTLDPLQQFVADGCHLTRQTGKQISDAGFSSIDLKTAFLSSVSLISPHVYGIACK
ncbi:methyltransferase-like protein 7A isoform X2 [Ananas comosus]|uniref:Methyltransferase-like protein 7A isoform X2 n=1 Tax=Ananas comosus TaxID=4615 RepID=A0A6P5EBH6_ANACO|nr:methyltransferase-like protein 7A isoform X2 [Ananas comosus]